jgi:uncharacterized protein YdiU (UPF0061 family)
MRSIAGSKVVSFGWLIHKPDMPFDPTYQPDPQFVFLGDDFSDQVRPAVFPEAILRYRNSRAATSVGLSGLDETSWVAHFARFEPLPANQPHPRAMRYHGHQFRNYNPDLGDGRGFLFAQLREVTSGRLLDLASKGSGQTPWSRQGDGRLTLKGGMREVLAASLLEARGVPTSRAFSLIETGEALQRNDEPSPTRSAVLTRLSHSHIRFGTFQRLAYLDRKDLIGKLVDHAVEAYYPQIADQSDLPLALFGQIVQRSARLVARWMAAGFVHGVLNTDNLVITGESFDYGPWRFLPHNDPNFVAAYFDSAGLYSFGRQPEAVFWNLQQLAGTLTLVTDGESLAEVLNQFSGHYRDALKAAMLNRLGLVPSDPDRDLDLVNAAFKALASAGLTLSWEGFFFDWFGGSASLDRALSGPRSSHYGAQAFAAFRDSLEGALPVPDCDLELASFQAADPEDLLVDEVEALWAAIDQRNDWEPFNSKLARIELTRQAQSPTPQWEIHASPDLSRFDTRPKGA